MPHCHDTIAGTLELLRQQDQYRTLRAMTRLGGVLEEQGRRVLNFSTNDYLNLSRHRRLQEAATAAIERYGCGATASRLVTGNTPEHEALEADLAALTGHERALVFPSGYQANLALISTLATPEDLIFSDQLNHASLIDGCRLSRATVRVYQHNDLDHLQSLLHETQGQLFRQRFILSDSLFSMDGDFAPVAGLRQLAHEHGALLILDEAHAVGVFGQRGGGVAQAAGILPDILLGTLSKSLGAQGGFVAASANTIEYLINRARPFIYSTGLNPASAAAAREALTLLRESPGLGESLLGLARQFRTQLQCILPDCPAQSSQILPIVIGSNEDALAFARQLLERDLLAVAIRPPTVPPGTARIRLSITLAHTPDDLTRAVEVITALRSLGGRP